MSESGNLEDERVPYGIREVRAAEREAASLVGRFLGTKALVGMHHYNRVNTPPEFADVNHAQEFTTKFLATW